ncbi:trypsin-like serine peptidase [Streptomyces sp. enrichment culture]|uniref:trypsin-like serine peptidase n=1 Tax=Streptomyces sp. enrichment culture TaxID=1795815 RepID=UPI003F56CAD4
MRSIRPSFSTRGNRRGRRGTSSAAAAVALVSALALTATACEDGDPEAGGDASASASAADDGNGGIRIPDHIKDKLKEHGIDVDDWKNGAWKDWNRDDWLREAQDFVNPIIEGLWDPDRMRDAEEPDQEVDENDISGDQGVTDPEPAPVEAAAVPAKYHDNAATAGKLLFDSPKGSMVCSATVVKDPAHPGKSNMVWTAGHCVHAGKSGGWYRNIAFVPSYNDADMSVEELQKATKEEIAPYGVWWGDWAQTSDQWIEQGGATGGDGASYDFAVIHVTPEKGGNGKSLEETVGAALPVDFDAPAVPEIESMKAIGYPAAPPYDGQKLYQCQDKPGRLSINASDPTMYRIGCTMTGGSSGGGWVAAGSDGKPALVSNTSIGPVTAGWLAGPRLGKEAEGVFDAVSGKFAGQ